MQSRKMRRAERNEHKAERRIQQYEFKPSSGILFVTIALFGTHGLLDNEHPELWGSVLSSVEPDENGNSRSHC